MRSDDKTGNDLSARLAGGGVHVVCLADPTAENTSELLSSGAGLDPSEQQLFCERVNSDDATGCLWPIARLSALPARFARAPLADMPGLEACLDRVLELNATLCKCPLLVLDLRAAAQNADQIADTMQRLLDARGRASLVRELIVL